MSHKDYNSLSLIQVSVSPCVGKEELVMAFSGVLLCGICVWLGGRSAGTPAPVLASPNSQHRSQKDAV